MMPLALSPSDWLRSAESPVHISPFLMVHFHDFRALVCVNLFQFLYLALIQPFPYDTLIRYIKRPSISSSLTVLRGALADKWGCTGAASGWLPLLQSEEDLFAPWYGKEELSFCTNHLSPRLCTSPAFLGKERGTSGGYNCHEHSGPSPCLL